MIDSRIATFIRNLSYSFLGNMSSKLITFLAVPVFTHALTPEAFGWIDTFQIVAYLAAAALALQLPEGVFRFCSDRNENRQVVMSTSVGLLVAMFGLAIPVSYGLVAGLWPQHLWTVTVMWLCLVPQVFYECLKQYSAGQNQFKLINLVDVFYTVCFMGMAISFVTGLKLGAFGYLYALAGAQWLAFVVLAFRQSIWQQLRVRAFQPAMARDLLRFTLPLVPSGVIIWVMNLVDRMLIMYFAGPAAVGLFVLARKGAIALSIIGSMFDSQFRFSLTQDLVNGNTYESRSEFVTRLFHYTVESLGLVTATLLLLVKPLFMSVIGPQFMAAVVFTPFVMLSALFRQLPFFIYSGLHAHKQTGAVLKMNLLITAANVLLGALLIPWLGVLGSALAAIFANCASFWFLVKQSEPLFRLTLRPSFYVLLATLLVQASSSYLPTPWLIVVNVACMAVVLSLNAATLQKILNKLLMPALNRRFSPNRG